MDALFESITPEHFVLRRPDVSTKNRQKTVKQHPIGIRRVKSAVKKSSSNETTVPMNPSLLDVILTMFRGEKDAPRKHYPGYLHFTQPPPPGHIHYDRTLTEWMDTIQKGQKSSLAFPFTRASNQALESYFLKQQRVRHALSIFALGILRRTIDARPHDSCDLFTTLPIPPKALVTVYDIPNRKKYTFHTHTAMKIIESSLYYASYGIARPLNPKNPYTNIPWTQNQLTSIVQQISHNLIQNHKFTPTDIQNFRTVRYCIREFYAKHKRYLDIMAARNLFDQKEDPYRNVIYEEILEDLHKDMHIRPNCTTLVMNKKLPVEIIKEWDDVVFAAFLEMNLNTFTDTYKSAADINRGFLDIHERTMEYRRSLRRATIASRTRTPVSTVIQTTNTTTVDAVALILTELMNTPVNTLVAETPTSIEQTPRTRHRASSSVDLTPTDLTNRFTEEAASHVGITLENMTVRNIINNSIHYAIQEELRNVTTNSTISIIADLSNTMNGLLIESSTEPTTEE